MSAEDCLELGGTHFVPAGIDIVGELPSTSVADKQRVGFGDSVRRENLTNSFYDTTMDSLKSNFNSYGVTYTSRFKNSKKSWSLSLDDSGLEEELYFSKNFAVQSIRYGESESLQKRLYTLDENIIDFFPAHFIVDKEEITDYHYEVLANTTDESEDFEHLFSSGFAKTIPLRFKIRKGENNTTKIFKRKRAVCAVDKNSLRIFCEDGDQWNKQLDFQVRSIVRSDYGLVLERSLMKLEREPGSRVILYPTVYTISHFHGDVCPVWKIVPPEIESANHYFSRLDRMEMLEFLPEDDIAVFYSAALKVHVFFYMRPVNNGELEMMQEVLHRKRQNSAKCRDTEDYPKPATLKELLLTQPPQLDFTMDSTRSSFHQSFNQSLNHSVSSNADSAKSSIITRSKSRIMKPTLSEFLKNSQSSPKYDTRLENFLCDKSQDTGSDLDFHSIRVNNSMNDINEMSLSLKRLSMKSPNKIEGKDGEDDIEVFGILPEYCMVYFGTENPTFQSHFCANKCFAITNLLGTRFICLLSKTNDGQTCLRMTKYSSSAKNIQPEVGETTEIIVKDAEPIHSMKMLLVLDNYNNLSLYSGTVQLCLITPNLSTEPIHHETTMDRSEDVFKTPKLLNKYKFMASTVTKTAKKTPSKASLVSTPLQDSRVKAQDSPNMSNSFSSENFSPFVYSPHMKIKQGIVQQLEHVVGNAFVFQTTTEKYYRCSLPELFSDPVVKQCITALLQTLDESFVNELVASWLVFRSEYLPKHENCELILFKICILKLFGYSQYHLLNSHPSFRDPGSSSFSNRKGELPFTNLAPELVSDEQIYQYAEMLKYSPSTNLFAGWFSDLDVGKSRNSIAEFELAFEAPNRLFEKAPEVLQSLHLVYEDFKLGSDTWQSAIDIVDILYLLACDLKLDDYSSYYRKDFEHQCPATWPKQERIAAHFLSIKFPESFPPKPLCIYEKLESFFSHRKSNEKIPFIGCDKYLQESVVQSIELVTKNIFKLSFLFANFCTPHYVPYKDILECLGNSRELSCQQSLCFNGLMIQKIKRICKSFADVQDGASPLDWKEKILFMMVLLKIDKLDMSNIPVGIATPLLNVLWASKEAPKASWPIEIFKLLDRYDLILQDYQSRGHSAAQSPMATFSELTFKNNFVNSKHHELNCFDQETLQLMFPNDQRIQDAFELLVSSKPVIIKCKQSHGVSDTEFMEQQEKILSQITPRTQAKCIGRGMMTLNTFATVWHERFDIPQLCLTGQSESYKTAIELANFDATTNYWPIFHNGCAAGLRIRNDQVCDPSWIQFNKPKVNAGPEELIKHAGFLFAMGLNGMMTSLQMINVYDYLSNNNDYTNVAVMLGLAAARRGTSDNMVFKILSLRLECLLPPTCTDLEISPMCRTASCMGLGLLFQGTGNSFIVEVLLNDIGKPPGPEMENYMDRESYSLTAGIALGMVTLGKGSSLDPYISPDGNTIPVQLHHYMQGAHKKSTCIAREHLRPSSFHVQEGMTINSNVTAPGAILALGLMYFNCNNSIITSWIKVPETQILLEYIRPDFLFLRMISHSLINWRQVTATEEWIMSHFPKILTDFYSKDKETLDKMQDFDRPFDYKLLGQCFCNILAGVCFSLALKYAGSHNLEAFGLVFGYIHKILDTKNEKPVPYLGETGKFTLETTVNSLLISCSIIMSGSGNIDILRLCRFLHYRTARDLTYGNFTAVHMALGLNFLGSCKLTLNASPESLPLLIMAFYPKYPSTTTDNRYHLQMFRHLYVLAVESRLLLAKSVDLKAKVHANIRFTFRDNSPPLVLETPCQVPQLDRLASIEVCDSNFWKVTYETPGEMKKIRNILRRSGIIFVKQRLNTLVYSEKELFKKGRDLRDRFLQLHMTKSNGLFEHCNDSLLKKFFLRFIFNKSSLTDAEFQDTQTLYRLIREFLDDETFTVVLPFLQLLAALCSLAEGSTSGGTDLSLPVENNIRKQKSLLLWQIRFISSAIMRFYNVPPKVGFLFLQANRFVDTI